MGSMKKEILEFRRKQIELESRVFEIKNENQVQILEILKQYNNIYYLPKTYLETMLDNENALEILRQMKEDGFITFEETKDNLMSLEIYKSKISKALDRWYYKG